MGLVGKNTKEANKQGHTNKKVQTGQRHVLNEWQYNQIFPHFMKRQAVFFTAFLLMCDLMFFVLVRVTVRFLLWEIIDFYNRYDFL